MCEMAKAERHFYDQGRYGEIAAKVDICMAHSAKPCKGAPLERMRNEDLDEDWPSHCDPDVGHCWRHHHTTDVAARLAQWDRRRANKA